MSLIRPAHPIRVAGHSLFKIALEHCVMFGAIWLIVTIVALAYAQFTPKLWPVTTTLAVREETGLSNPRPGEFISIEARKSSQETVLQLANSTSVLRGALARLDELHQHDPSQISTEQIEKAQKLIRLSPPKGIDWGASEMFFLTIKDETPARAVALTKALIAEVDLRLGELRCQRNSSLATELEQSMLMAEAELNDAMKKMSTLESSLGPDLAELRIMTEPSSGESNLRRTLTEVAAELRQTRSQMDGNRTLLELLQAARQDPSRLIATPGRLLDSQPSLRKLKEGIVDAENRTAQLRGNLHESHPKVKSAKAIEEQAKSQLFTELALAIEGVQVEVRVSEQRFSELQTRQEEIEARLGRLAKVRAEYGLLASQVKDRGEVVKRTREQLAEVQSSRAAANKVSVLTMVDAPIVGLRPDGLGRTTICVLGFLGGFVIAFLSLMAIAPASQWRSILEAFEEEREQAEFPIEHGVLAAWLSGVKPLRRERLPASSESSLTTKQ